MRSPRNYPGSGRARIRPAVLYDISRPTTTLPLTKIRLLEQLVAELQQALESLSEIEIPDISQGT